MQILLAFATLVTVVTATSRTPPLRQSESVLVRAVIDGSTVDVTQFGRVHLLGIQVAPLLAQAARERLAGLVLNRWVRLELDDARGARTHRTAYVVTEDRVCANTVLVREGLARVTARTATARLEELQQAEAEAQRLEKGMWGYTPPPAGPAPP